ncbi:hypothetical protein [Pseudozobellia sp. WGM2]|uniref:hypothetical protein n=1 Tax=Pseudozobellia sp. WGM2 TaxID=2787625 RepID=UPI001AE03F6B|nr:hypothetical protein [Pseudozobellia sp. WGM2]
MNSKTVQVKYCLLGYGYASLIAYDKLVENNNHDDILILKNKNFSPIFTLDHENTSFSPLPIFPVKESELYNSSLFEGVSKQEPISVSFSELTNFDHTEYELKEGSLADFMIKKQGVDKNLCLGLKQWGDTMFSRPFSQVQSKIARHYISKKGNTRVGYIDGKSLFKYAVDKFDPEVLECNGVNEINIEKKEIYTDEYTIKYDKLVSTIPFSILLKLCNLESNHDDSYASAFFYFFKYEDGFKENQIIYDCDLNSDILRVFSLTDNFLLTQLRSDKYGEIPVEKIRDRVYELVPEIEKLEFAQELYVPMAYPLELISGASTLKSLETLKGNDVVPFGRFGQWEYSDLHELDWTLIN